MANPLPVAVKQVMKANGGAAPVSLLELQTASGNRYFWSDARISAPSVLATFDGEISTPVIEFLLTPNVVLTVSSNIVGTSTSITVTATVTPTTPGPVPTGSVGFVLGSGGTYPDYLVTIALVAGVATWTTTVLGSSLSSSDYVLIALYLGDSVYAGTNSTGQPLFSTTASGLQAANTVLTVPSIGVAAGVPTTLTATVSAAAGGSGTPGGSVTFYSSPRSSFALVPTAIATVALSGGVATLTSTSLIDQVGNWIYAVYSGDSSFATSTSGYFSPLPGTGSTVSGPSNPTFLPWLMQAPSIHSYRTTETASGQVSVQNLSGNTVQRDVSLLFSRNEFLGALVYYRLWRVDCEYALKEFCAYVSDTDINADGDRMTLSLKGVSNWSEINAPAYEISTACPLAFASMACGSTSSTPCNNSYGTCSSLNRFAGLVTEWDNGSIDSSQYVQPDPLRVFNPRKAG